MSYGRLLLIEGIPVPIECGEGANLEKIEPFVPFLGATRASAVSALNDVPTNNRELGNFEAHMLRELWIYGSLSSGLLPSLHDGVWNVSSIPGRTPLAREWQLQHLLAAATLKPGTFSKLSQEHIEARHSHDLKGFRSALRGATQATAQYVESERLKPYDHIKFAKAVSKNGRVDKDVLALRWWLFLEAWRFDWTAAATLAFDRSLVLDEEVPASKRADSRLVDLVAVLGAADPTLAQVSGRLRTWVDETLQSGFNVGDDLSARVVDERARLDSCERLRISSPTSRRISRN